ncbi:MAG TPA: PepSY domain-containing protein [Pirellulales bacterium]|nr:PepSY domain-containing protein [Pirellulales bacterium]
MKYRSLAIAGAVALACSLAAVTRAGEDKQQEFERAKAGLEKAKLTLAEAVEAASKKVPDGKAVEAEIETEAGGAAFEVEVVSGTKHLEVKVDADNGDILGVEEEVEEEEEARKGEKKPDDEQLENEAAATSKISLLHAIRTASKEVEGGKPFEASFARHNGLLAIEVELLDGSEIKEVFVDAQTGAVLEVKQEFTEDMDDEGEDESDL